MSALTWDNTGERYFETGVEKCVLYVKDDTGAYGEGVAWNGVTSISESPDGAEADDFWADNIKYASMRSAETFGCSIEAYTYPDEFMECDGTKEAAKGVYFGQQSRKGFGLCYKTQVGSDTDSDATSYKLHLVYNCMASPSDKGYETINDSPDAITFSWEVDTTAVKVTGYKPVATIVIDSRKADATKLTALEKILYGDTAAAKLPTPDEVLTAMAS